MQSTRRGTDRANTRLYSPDPLPPVRTKKRRVLQLEPLEERTLLSTYNIGPGQPYTTLGSFPWSSLGPGDTVDIHWQPTPYYEKLLISESGTASAPINIVGVPGPNGQQPIIDGDNATTSSQFQYFYNPMQEDAVVLIGPSASQSRSYTPSYINISGLEIRNGYQAYNFTDNTGTTQTYGAFAASVWIEGASNITIQNCTLDSSGLGLFALTDDDNGMMTSNLMVEGNYFYNNGVPGSYSEHNSYCEVNGITYQYNYYGPLRAGSAGAELKDRSAGAVIRDNYFTPAATILDLVDAEDSPTLAALPSYANTYVYGNIFDDTGPNVTSIPVEFGGDSGLPDYRPNLYFYDNTVVTIYNQSTYWRTDMFELFTSGQTAYVANNIFYNAAATSGSSPSIFEFSGEQGNINFSPTNWVSPGSLASESVELQQDYGGALNYNGTITGTNTWFVDPNNNPGFVNLSGEGVSPPDNYQLASGSNAIGIAGTIPSSWTSATGWPGLPTEQFVPPSTFFGGSGTARTSVADIGAYQAGAVTPTVTSETPASGATNVAVSTAPTAAFNEAVQAGTISFTLENSSGSSVAGSVSYNSTTNVTTFTPTSALAYNTTYTATVSGAENSSSVAMTAPFSWSFTTDAAPPSVTSETPASGATGVAVSTTASATFNEAVQAGTISFTLENSSGSSVAATVTYNSSNNTVTLTPSAALAYSTTYTATVSGATDSAGDPMTSAVSWSFTTAAAVAPAVTSETPASGATNVAVSTAPTATFNEAVQAGTISFTLKSSSGTVAGSSSYNSTTNVTTFTPTSALAYSTTYTATISGAESTSGVTISAPFSWSFTTAAAVAPAMTSETPASGATKVAVLTAPTATFNEALQASTISFTLKNSSGSTVAGSISYNSTTYVTTFTPTSALASNTTYTATVSGAESSSGVSMTAPFSWSFTTAAAVAPKVTSETPASGATKVAVSTAPTATFNEALQASTISFTLKNSSGKKVAGSISYNSTTYVTTFTPTSALANNTTYTATISGAKSTSGVTMTASFSWSFTTAAASHSATTATAENNESGQIAVAPSSGASSQLVTGAGSIQPGGLAIPGHGSASATAKFQGKSLGAQWVPAVVGRLNPAAQSALVKPINRRFMTLGGSDVS